VAGLRAVAVPVRAVLFRLLDLESGTSLKNVNVPSPASACHGKGYGGGNVGIVEGLNVRWK
jgi:hypothetical protein